MYSVYSVVHGKSGREVLQLTPCSCSLRSLFGGGLNGTDRLPVGTVTVVRAEVNRIEVVAPCVVTARNRDGRPGEADRTGMVERSPVAVAGVGKEDTVRGVVARASDDAPGHAVRRRRGPVALAHEVVQFLRRRHTPAPTPLHVRCVMPGCEHAVSRHPTGVLQVRHSLTERIDGGIGIRKVEIERSIRRQAMPLRVAPPEVEAVVLRLFRADIGRRPVRAARPELDLLSRTAGAPASR